MFLGVRRVRGHFFQGGDGIGAAERRGGLGGCVPDFFLGIGQVGQNVGQGGRVIVRGPFLEAAGLGVNGSLALFGRQGVGGGLVRREWMQVAEATFASTLGAATGAGAAISRVGAGAVAETFPKCCFKRKPRPM